MINSGRVVPSFASFNVPPLMTKVVDAVPDNVKVDASNTPTDILRDDVPPPPNLTSEANVVVPAPDFCTM